MGIVATIVGTPLTALMAKEHGHVPTPMLGVTAALVVAAFLPPAPRVAGFVGLGGVACEGLLPALPRLALAGLQLSMHRLK